VLRYFERSMSKAYESTVSGTQAGGSTIADEQTFAEDVEPNIDLDKTQTVAGNEALKAIVRQARSGETNQKSYTGAPDKKSLTPAINYLDDLPRVANVKELKQEVAMCANPNVVLAFDLMAALQPNQAQYILGRAYNQGVGLIYPNKAEVDVYSPRAFELLFYRRELGSRPDLLVRLWFSMHNCPITSDNEIMLQAKRRSIVLLPIYDKVYAETWQAV